MSLESVPLIAVLFLIAGFVLAGFMLYAHKAGRIRGVYTGVAGALLGVVFALLIALFTDDLGMASAVGLIVFAWFFAMSRLHKRSGL